MLIAFIIGFLLPYEQRSIVLLALPLVFLLVFYFIPETPAFEKKRGDIVAARKAMRFYQNAGDSITESELDSMFQGYDALVESSGADNVASAWSVFSKRAGFKCFQKPERLFIVLFADTRHGRRATILAFGLICAAQCTGCFVMLNYTASIFLAAGLPMDANLAAILMGVIQLLGAYMSTVLVDRLGRKVF